MIDYRYSYLARADMLYCACNAHHRANPDKYLTGKAKRYGPMLLEAYQIDRANPCAPDSCLAAQIDKVDAIISARHGWQTVEQWRADTLKTLQQGLHPPVKLSLQINGLEDT